MSKIRGAGWWSARGYGTWCARIRTERVVREPYPTAGYPMIHQADVADIAVAALRTDSHSAPHTPLPAG